MIVGVSFDSPDDNKKFAEKNHFNFPLICDTDRTIGTAYGANADPQKGAQRVGGVLEERVGDRRHQQGQQQAERLPTDDDDGDGATLLGAGPGAHP